MVCGLVLGACAGPAPAPGLTPSVEATPIAREETLPTHTSAAPTATATPTPQPTITPTTVFTPGESIFGASIVPLNEKGGLLQMAEAGLYWTRYDLVWKRVEPYQGARAWENIAYMDQQVAAATQAGMKVILIINETPGWALKAGFSCGAVREEYFDALAKFSAEVVARYSQAPYHVKNWEIYNEPDAPNFLGCWGDVRDKEYFGGAYYGKMLQKVYPAMKSADPEAQVLVGGLLMDCDPVNPPEIWNKPGVLADCTPGRFFEGILESGAQDAFDGVAFHSYDYYYDYGVYTNPNWHSSRIKDGSSTLAKAAYLRGLMEKYGVKDRYLVNTEFALFCGRDNDPTCNPYLDKVEATKAYYAVHFMATSMADDYRTAIWYAVFYTRNNSLLNKDMSPKPVYHAMQFTNQMIGQARYLRTVSDPNFIIHEFRVAKGTVWVVWTVDAQAHVLDLPALPSQVYVIGMDGMAQEAAPAQQISLDVAPAFLVFEE